MARALVPTVESAGGRVLVKADVDEILVEDAAVTGVRVNGGTVIHAPIVVSSAGCVPSISWFMVFPSCSV